MKKFTTNHTAMLLGLLLVLLGVMSFVDVGAKEPAPAPAPRKNIVASAFMCPGMEAVWLSEDAVQCLKVKP